MRSFLLLPCALAAIGAPSVGCQRRTNDAGCAGDASTRTTSAEMAATATAAPGQVVVVMPPATTSAEPPSPPHEPTRPAPPPPVAEPAAPAWVPDAGRLSIIQAPDLARNLGIEPAPDAGAPARP